MSQPQADAGFATIGPGIYISLAPTVSAAPTQPNDSDPNVILIFGWMGALTRHLRTYSREYTELYPHATQIIVKCAPSFFWTCIRAQQDRLLPVAEILEALGCLPSPNHSTESSTRIPPRILVHSLSNGGAFQVIPLSRLLSSKYPSVSPSKPFVSAFILDSSPAIGDFRSIGMAFSVAIPDPAYRYFALVIIYFLHAFFLCLHTLFGVETRVTQYPKALLNPHLLPWMTSQTPRLYVFSKKDEMVPWKAVQQHAEAATSSGLNVRCEVYEESAHVAHMRFDPKRYWASIQDLWQNAYRQSRTTAIESDE